MSRVSGHVRTTALGIGAAAILMFSGLAPASAHVAMKADTTASGSTGLVRFFFSHGCEGSATTQVAIAIPEEIASVNPGMHSGWTVEKVTEESATPADAATPAADDHEERVTEVVYTAEEPVPDGFYDELVLQVALPEDAEGETIYFPVIQTCEEGETAWIEIPAEGQDGDELESPAPSITLTEPDPDAGH